MKAIIMILVSLFAVSTIYANAAKATKVNVKGKTVKVQAGKTKVNVNKKKTVVKTEKTKVSADTDEKTVKTKKVKKVVKVKKK